MNQSANTSASPSGALSRTLGVVVDSQTYRNLLYLLLAFPLGMAYYVILVTGFALGLGLSVLVVGIGILLATVIGLRYVASFERWLANVLLGTEIGDPNDVEKDGDGIVETAKAYLRASSTWRGLGFIFLKFWLGVLSFVLLVTFLGVAVELLLIPLFPEGALNVQVGGWEVAQTIETTTEQAVAVPIGAALAIVAMHVLNAFARVNASIASSLLGSTNTDTDDLTEPNQPD
jgi:hypothetical protein